MPGVEITSLGRVDGTLAALAVSGDVLATCVERRVEISTGVRAGRLVPAHSWTVPADIGAVALAPSGRYLVMWSAARDAIAVQPTDGGPPVMQFTGDLPGRPTTAAAIAETPNGELLVTSTERHRLQVRRLDTGELLHDELVREPRPFFYRFLVPLSDGDTVIAIGYYIDETKDSLVALSIGSLLTENDYLPHTLHRPELHDYAYRLTAGPCGPAEAVFFRDPEHDEDENDPVDRNRLDVTGIHGLYVRRLSDRAVVETVPIDVSVPSGSALAATEHNFVLAVDDGALVVPRSRSASTLVPANQVTVDPLTGRTVLASLNGELRLLTPT